MKKIIAVSISILILSGCAINKGTNKYINKKIGIDISKCKIEKDKDTHGGFLGDGYYIVIANCEQKPLTEMEKITFIRKLTANYVWRNKRWFNILI